MQNYEISYIVASFSVYLTCLIIICYRTVSDIYTYASLRGMKLNSKKCKEMIINFMQYSPFPPAPLTVGGSVIERVVTYKLLGVYISDDLSWNVHIEHIVKKAKKRLYALRALKKSALTITQLV